MDTHADDCVARTDSHLQPFHSVSPTHVSTIIPSTWTGTRQQRQRCDATFSLIEMQMKSWIRSSRQILNHNNGDNQPDSLSSTDDQVRNSSGIAKETKKKTNFPTPPKPQSLNYMRSENSFLFTNYIIIVSLAVAAAVSSTFNRVLPSLLSLSSTTEILLSTPTPFAQFEVVAWRSFNLIHHNERDRFLIHFSSPLPSRFLFNTTLWDWLKIYSSVANRK